MACYARWMGVEGQHWEVVVQLRPEGDRDRVGGWLRQRNLDVLPLAVGLLATGDTATVRAAFAAELEGELPVPAELSADVESIFIAPPKQLHMDE
jgi:hypothetical protein